MTVKRLLLGALTVLAIVFVVGDLISSWSQPQFGNRLELYETDLLLQASQWQGEPDAETARKALSGVDPINTALEQYQKTRETAQKSVETIKVRLAQPAPESSIIQTLPASQKQLAKQQSLVDELDLRIGLLQTQQEKVNQALKTWAPIADRSPTASILTGLWSDPPRLFPNAEAPIQKNLNGWFRYRALDKLYQLQQRSDAIRQLEATEQQSAKQAFFKWAIANLIPTALGFSGLALLIFLIGQWFVRGKQAILSGTNDVTWSTPWGGEIVWQVLVVGFFFVGQILLPLGIQIVRDQLKLSPEAFGERGKAAYFLITYLLLASGGLTVLYLSIKPFLPLPDDWFHATLKGKWFLWGFGGYLAAFPLVIIVSLVNQRIWQGQGGSNPILPIALEGKDTLAIATFFVTAAIVAPIFEEILFRGFLLPSLTRYFSTWQAILLSSFLFAIVHLSLSEVLPLMTLGIVLGFVYTRTQNLLASMLLHSLWNSGTLLSLFILGSGSS
ncbi:CPBP family intramembrane glutamic endopeptidase [Phormidesmis priestleyi]